MQKTRPKVWCVLWKTVKWAAGVPLVIVVAIVALNAFDEDLLPEARALLVAPQNPWQPQQNLYLALMGSDALPGESPIVAGQAYVARDVVARVSGQNAHDALASLPPAHYREHLLAAETPV